MQLALERSEDIGGAIRISPMRQGGVAQPNTPEGGVRTELLKCPGVFSVVHGMSLLFAEAGTGPQTEGRTGRDPFGALRSAHEELQRSQAFIEALLEALPVGVVAADEQGRVRLFNRVSRLWHGQDTDAGLGPGELSAAYDLFEADGTTPLGEAGVPLLGTLREQEVTGAETVIRPHGRAPRTVSCTGTRIQDTEGRLLGAVVAMADVTEQRALERRLREAALHDPLTGLPNRTLLIERLGLALQAALRDSAHVGVLYGDLDGFKAVNDRHGHAVGDEVLIQAADRLLGVVRPGDTVARVGGDEFVLLCPGLRSLSQARVLSHRVQEAFVEPFRRGSESHQMGISIGCALSGSDSRPDTLLASADRAMYENKARRRSDAVRP